jgi:uncharacterized metal-binding protein
LKADTVKIPDKQLSVITCCALMHDSRFFIAIYLLESELVLEAVAYITDFKLEVLHFEIKPLRKFQLSNVFLTFAAKVGVTHGEVTHQLQDINHRAFPRTVGAAQNSERVEFGLEPDEAAKVVSV